MTLEEWEHKLKIRWKYPYKCGQKQNNGDNNATRFVYDVFHFDIDSNDGTKTEKETKQKTPF